MASFMYISSGLSGLVSLWIQNYLTKNYETQSFETMCQISCVTIAISFYISRSLFKDEEIRHKDGIFEKMLPSHKVNSSSISFDSESTSESTDR